MEESSYREAPPRREREIYRRSPFAYLSDAFAGLCILCVAFPILAGALFVILRGAAALGAPVPPLSQLDLDEPFEWEELTILAGCVLFGGVLVRLGGAYFVGIVLPAVEVVATVERRQQIRVRGTRYTVTIGGVTSDAAKELYEVVREGDHVRIKRLRGSHEIIRVMRAD